MKKIEDIIKYNPTREDIAREWTGSPVPPNSEVRKRLNIATDPRLVIRHKSPFPGVFKGGLIILGGALIGFGAAVTVIAL